MRVRKKNSTSEETGSVTPQVSVARFAVTYLLLMGAFFLLIGLKSVQDIIDLNGLYTHWVVVATAKVIGAIGLPCTYQGSIIQLPSIALDVKFGCNGLEAVMIYSVAVIAFPSSWRNRLAGIAVGLVVIQVINILRIAGLAYAGVHLINLFEYIHIYIAQGLMIAVSFGVFLLYLNYEKNHRPVSA